jgi:hypothetical protein
MTDEASNPPSPSPRRRHRQVPKGEITRIDVPKPPDSARNPQRPVSDLIKAQLRHVQHAENARLPHGKRSGVDIRDLKTEGQAAEYIRQVTLLLHPQGRKRSRKKKVS